MHQFAEAKAIRELTEGEKTITLKLLLAPDSAYLTAPLRLQFFAE